MPSINRLSYTYQGIIFSTSTLLKISALSKEIKSPKELLNINYENRLKLSNFNNELHLQNIFFKYGDKPILNNLNLKIKKGQAVGIYGVSGGGKTTLINIIAGLVSADEGKILLDGKEVKVDNSDWQNFIGYVPQSVNLLDDTIINNITFCENNKNDDEFLLDVAKQAQILELIKDSGNKNVGERGLRMSGGQLQRLSIARALYKKPSILIFDEATNALDETTEKKVFDTIYSLKGKVTLILISHNLNNLNKCDLKFKLSDGKLDKI
jgi:ABC-type bacteriocin/lantibiotic exporter with double-glycine peptidase domain